MWTLDREVLTWLTPQADTAAEPELEYSCKHNIPGPDVLLSCSDRRRALTSHLLLVSACLKGRYFLGGELSSFLGGQLVSILLDYPQSISLPPQSRVLPLFSRFFYNVYITYFSDR